MSFFTHRHSSLNRTRPYFFFRRRRAAISTVIVSIRLPFFFMKDPSNFCLREPVILFFQAFSRIQTETSQFLPSAVVFPLPLVRKCSPRTVRRIVLFCNQLPSVVTCFPPPPSQDCVREEYDPDDATLLPCLILSFWLNWALPLSFPVSELE